MSYGLGFLTPGATDEGQVLDPASVLKRRRIVEAMMEKGTDTSPLQSPWQGAARVVQGALAGYEGGRLDKQESDERKRIGGLTLFDGDASPGRANVTAALAGDPPPPSAPKTAPSFASNEGDIGSYLAQIRARESGGNDLAANPNSTAKGRYQFTDSTWAGVAKRHPDLGLQPGGWRDPAQQEKAMQAFTGDNAKALTSAGLPINPANLYGSHFLGEAGGPEFIRNALNSPDAPASSFVSAGAAKANRSVFFNKDGTPKTAGQVYAWMGGGPASPQTPVTRVADALSDVPAEGAVPAQFQIPGEAPAQTAGQAGVTDALTGGGRRVNLRNAAEIAASPYASPQIRAVAQALLTQAAKPQEFGFTTLPDGTVLRQDPRAGTVSPIYRSEPKPDVDVREVGGRLVATDKRSLSSQDVTPPGAGGGKLERELEQRKAAAAQMGLKPGDPGYQSYALTGKMPREDARPLSAGDKRAIMTAEDALPEIDSTIDTLSRAKELNGQTYTGFGAGILGKTGTTFPGAGLLLDQKAAGATREFNQLMSMEAIKSMSATLKGATTDREMGRFMDILGDPTTPPEIRAKTIDRMLTLAQRQKEIATDRLNQLRAGSYYRPTGGQSAAGAAEAPERRALPAPSPANRPGAGTPADRFRALVGSGLSKQQAYERLQQEGY